VASKSGPAEQTEGTRSQILRWLKQVGDSVAENEPLIEIETDKVTSRWPRRGRECCARSSNTSRRRSPRELLGRIDAGTAAALARHHGRRGPACGEHQSDRGGERDPRGGGCRGLESGGAPLAE